MKIEYDVQVPGRYKAGQPRTEEYVTLKGFMESAHETLKITYDTPNEARRRRQSIDVTIKRKGIPVFTALRKNELYFIKKEGEINE